MPDDVLTPGAGDRLKRARGFVIDLDGTLALGDYLGDGLVPLPGAKELLSELTHRGIPFVVFTNGTLRTPHETAQKLRKAGFALTDEQAMTPSTVAAECFASRKLSPVLVLGCEGVWQPLVDAGIEVVLPRDYCGGVQAVYVGWYREFTMACLEAAFDAINQGADYYSASNIPFFASAGGRALGTSFVICTMLEALTKKPSIVLGKPSDYALKTAGRILDVPISNIAVVGDDPTCEIRLARYGDALAIGVTTGFNKREVFETQKGEYRPDMVIDGVAELNRYLR